MSGKGGPIEDGGTAIQSSTEQLGGDVQGDSQTRPIEELLIGPDSELTPVVSVVMPTMNEEEGIGTCRDSRTPVAD
jgi:hypothetical protein